MFVSVFVCLLVLQDDGKPQRVKASKKSPAKVDKAQILDPEHMVETPSKALG